MARHAHTRHVLPRFDAQYTIRDPSLVCPGQLRLTFDIAARRVVATYAPEPRVRCHGRICVLLCFQSHSHLTRAQARLVRFPLGHTSRHYPADCGGHFQVAAHPHARAERPKLRALTYAPGHQRTSRPALAVPIVQNRTVLAPVQYYSPETAPRRAVSDSRRRHAVPLQT